MMHLLRSSSDSLCAVAYRLTLIKGLAYKQKAGEKNTEAIASKLLTIILIGGSMMQRKRKRTIMIGLTAAVIALFAFSACDTSSGYGVMKVSITDSPLTDEDVQGVYITIEEIQYHTTNGGWEILHDYEGPQTFDLLALTRGESRMLGELTLPSGNYTQIRFMLGAPDGSSSLSDSGSWIAKGNSDDANYIEGEFNADYDVELFVPSGAQSGYKAIVANNGYFSVPLNGTVEITADFDLRRAVVVLGNGDYNLKPVLRLMVNDQAGVISGNIEGSTALADGSTYEVYAYESGTYGATESEEPAEGDTRFPLAVTSSELKAGEAADYVLAFLAEGTYDLYGAEYDTEGVFQGATSLGVNVEVTAGDTTTYDLENVTW